MLTLFQVLFAGTIKHRRAVWLWDWSQPKLWLWGCSHTGSEFSKCHFISLFPLLLWFKISFFIFFWNLCVRIKFLSGTFLWPFFPKAPSPECSGVTVSPPPLLRRYPLIVLSFQLFILPENRMEFAPPALKHNSAFVQGIQSFTFMKCAETEMRSACCVRIPWLTMRGDGCFCKRPK